VHPVGFTIEMYDDALGYERQNLSYTLGWEFTFVIFSGHFSQNNNIGLGSQGIRQR